MTVAYMVVISVQNEKIALFAYSIFFIFADVLLLSVFDFSRKYTKYKVRLPWFNYILIGGGILDSTSSFLNFFFQHYFSLSKIKVPAAGIFPAAEIFKIDINNLFGLHLFCVYFMILMTIISLCIRLFLTPKLYRTIFTNLILSVFITAAGNTVFMFSHCPLDFSILVQTISILMVGFYSLRVIPSKLIQKQLQAVVSHMNDAVIVFDIDSELIYKNMAMENFQNKYTALGLNPTGPFKSLLEKNSYKKLKFLPDRDFDEDVVKNGCTYSFHISIRSLRDEKDTFLGVFFIVHDKTDEMEKLNQERYITIHDKLTGLYNIDGFYEKVKSYLANNQNNEYLMICADIDNFKLINDIFSNEVGDEFLIRTANSIKKHSKDTEIFARLNNDRFALLMKKEDYDEEKFIKYSEDISYIKNDLYYPVTFHIGVYEIEDITMPVSVMCDRAFMAINTIKGNLLKKVAYYNSDIRKSIVREQRLIGEFPAALASEQFQVYLQPQVSVSGDVFGAEALVRWKHPKEGLMNPNDFIPLFEKKGLITTMDMFIWNRVCEILKKWKDFGCDNMYISVNISPRDFVYIDIYKTFVDLVKKYNISPKNLKLEITETGILMNLDSQLILINKLRNYGFQIEIDDFGSGYSSLNMLKDIPFDLLKIDMAFLQDTKNQERSIQILHSIIKLSKRLGMPVITEGVETKEQVEFLRDMGTDFYQGFYFSRPMPVNDFQATYLEGRK